MKFPKMSQCFAPSGSVAFVMMLALSSSSARAAVLTYEMTVAPNAEAVPMVLQGDGDGFGDTASGDQNSPNFSGLQDGTHGTAGTARFVDSGGHGNDGFTVQGFAGGFTVDMRIAVEGNTGPGGDARSIGIRANNGGGGAGRAIGFVTGTGDGFTLQVRSSGVIATATIPDNGSNATAFHMIRLVLPDNGHLLVYDLEDDLDAGPGVQWNLLLDTATITGLTGCPAELTTAGGIALNSLSGGITQTSKFSLDWMRINDSVALGATDPIIPAPVAPGCSVSVTPPGAQTSSGYELGATPAPANVNYTITNTGASTVNWTATEVDSLGAPFNYPWLSLSAGSGSVAVSSSSPVAASFSTTSLTANTYTAYLKFANDCATPAPCFSDTFTYSNGALVGNGGWAGTATSSDISIASNEVHIVGGATDVDASKTTACASGGTGVISVKVRAKGITAGGTTWHMWANDGSGNQFGRWSGTGTTAHGRDAGATVTADQNLGTGVFHDLEMRIHTASNQLEFLFDNVVIGTMPHNPAAGDTIGSVRFERLNNANASEIVFDNLEVSVLPQQIRRVDLTVVGCSIEVQEPRIRYVGPCSLTSTTTEVFTIKNNGSADWTGFQANEVSDDDDWMTVTYTSSPVVRFATATVNATINWSQVPITTAGDDQASRIQFGATCTGGSSFVFDTPVVGPGVETVNVLDNVATPPVKLIYNGDVTPGTTNSAGTGFKFQLFEGIDQGAVVADGGVGQAADGFAYRLQDTSSAKTKWQSVTNADATAMDIDGKIGATALARVKVASATGSLFQANLMILHPAIAAAYHWGGVNNIVKEAQRDVFVTIAGDANYHILRVTSKDTLIPGTGIVVNLYLDENPTPVLTLTNAAASAHGAIDAIGFGAGSTAADQDIYFDWVTGTNSGAFAPGEEVACIGSLIPASNCNIPKVDADDDGDVDMDDFAVFQTCYTGSLVSPPPLSQLCDCFDNDNDNDVDVADFNAFVNCETGASVPWVTSGLCPN